MSCADLRTRILRTLRFPLSTVGTHGIYPEVQVLIFPYLLKAQLLNTKGQQL